MGAIYISVILVCRVVQAIFSKRSSMEVRDFSMMIGYSAFKNAVSAVLAFFLILITGCSFFVSLPAFLIAFLSGLSLFAAGFCSIYAMKTGTISLTSMFGTAGMLIPFLAGIFWFGQPVRLWQWVGVALFFVGAWLLIISSNETHQKLTGKTILLLFGSMLANGCTMLAQQLFVTYAGDCDVTVFSLLSFGLISLFSALALLVAKKSPAGNGEKHRFLSRPLMVCGVVLAAAVFIINQLATKSAALVPPVILFAFINGGATIISSIVGAVMYREKLTAKTVTGIILGISALIMIKCL